jgi:hypothetical protein
LLRDIINIYIFLYNKKKKKFVMSPIYLDIIKISFMNNNSYYIII